MHAFRAINRGDVCGFLAVVIVVVISSGGGGGEGGGGGRVHPVDQSTEILIPWPFQPLPPQKLVNCGVLEVGDLVVWSSWATQRQNGLCYLPPPSAKKILPNPLKKCSRHAIPWPFQPKPLRPSFD